MVTPCSCSQRTLESPRRNQSSSRMMLFRCTFLVVSSGKPAREIEAQLPPEHPARAGAGAVAAVDAVVQNILEQAEIGDVGLRRGLRDRFGCAFIAAYMGRLAACSYNEAPPFSLAEKGSGDEGRAKAPPACRPAPRPAAARRPSPPRDGSPSRLFATRRPRSGRRGEGALNAHTPSAVRAALPPAALRPAKPRGR